MEIRQRTLERNVRKWKRLEEGSSDPANTQTYKRKRLDAQKELREFIKEHDNVLRRDYWREKTHGIPYKIDKAETGNILNEKQLKNQAEGGIITSGRDNMGLSIEINDFTPCLVERATGKILDTEMHQINIKKSDYRGWNFDWSIPKRNGYDVFALKIKNDDIIQGLIAQKIEPSSKAVHVDIVETAPHNFGRNGKYNGVGAHLFAHACKTALDNGYTYIYFDAKTNLIDYYKDKLGAEQLGRSQRMIVEGTAFANLLNAYYGGK